MKIVQPCVGHERNSHGVPLLPLSNSPGMGFDAIQSSTITIVAKPNLLRPSEGQHIAEGVRERQEQDRERERETGSRGDEAKAKEKR